MTKKKKDTITNQLVHVKKELAKASINIGSKILEEALEIEKTRFKDKLVFFVTSTNEQIQQLEYQIETLQEVLNKHRAKLEAIEKNQFTITKWGVFVFENPYLNQ